MLKGKQKNLDANKDGKISGEDFAMLRAKRKPMKKMGGGMMNEEPIMADEGTFVKRRKMLGGAKAIVSGVLGSTPIGRAVKGVGAGIGVGAGVGAVAKGLSDLKGDKSYEEGKKEGKKEGSSFKERAKKKIGKALGRAEGVISKRTGGMMNEDSMGYEKGGSVTARGYKLTRSKPTKLY